MNKRNLFLLVSVVLILALTACTKYKPGVTGDVILPGDEIGTDGEVTGGVIDETNKSLGELESEADIVAYEGDLIDLKPLVKDPDGDEVVLGYTAPFDKNGVWQTKLGDAGFYSVIITATDNKDSFVTKEMTVKVLIKNKAPVIDIPDTLEFNEGDLIILSPKITDPDNTEVFVTYSGWMSSKTYQTTFDDAGSYKVTIMADDGIVRVYKDVTLLVKEVNRKPEITLKSEKKITVTEGDLVSLAAEAKDPEGDKVTLTFSAPLSESGKWQTKKGDVGTYNVKAIASDGVNEVSEEVEIEVLKKNLAPVLESVSVTPLSVVLKKPGDKVTVKIDVVASDPDGDELTITYSGYMDSAEKTVEYGEKGGVKTVTVTVSDGKESVSKDVSFDMNNWPCFDCQ